MAMWPPASLSGSQYPETREVRLGGPNVLVTRFSDGSENVRVKSRIRRRTFLETWRVNRDDAKIMRDFFDVYGLSETFSALCLDPQDGDDFATVEALVRFTRPVEPIQIGPKWFRVEVEYYEAEL